MTLLINILVHSQSKMTIYIRCEVKDTVKDIQDVAYDAVFDAATAFLTKAGQGTPLALRIM